MKVSRVLVAVALVSLGAHAVYGGDSTVVFEVAGANLSPSTPADADWGWWNPGKYDEWTEDGGANFGLADIRLLVSNKTYTVILDGEWYPTMDAVGTSDTDPSKDELVQNLSLKNSAYDLGIGYRFGKDLRTGAMPWVGLTYMRLSESRTTVPPAGSGGSGVTDSADAGLWGVVVGVDGSYRVWSTLDVTGRLLLRWATGTRNATINPQDPDGGSSGGSVEVNDSIDAGMWGVDLGVRWNATKAFSLEVGWRYRDQTYDGGPATYGGPQIKFAYVFQR